MDFGSKRMGKIWFENGKRVREVTPWGVTRHFKGGELHRDDGPAVERTPKKDEPQLQEWWTNGVHRKSAWLHADGTKELYQPEYTSWAYH